MKYLGPNACFEALKRGSLQTLRIAQSAWCRTKVLRESASSAGVVIRREPAESLDRRAEGSLHQGVIGEGSDVCLTKMSGLLEALHKRGNSGLILVLDGITDPHNFGAILRSAAAANVDGVVFQERRSAQINETVIRASAGTAGRVLLVRVVNLGRAIDELKEAGIRVVGMSASVDNCHNYLTETFGVATAIVLGSEGEGMRQKIEERCDSMLKIDMPGQIDSLNVSATAAVILFRALAIRGKNY